MRGRWIGYTGLVCLATSLGLHQLVGLLPGLLLAVAASVLGKFGLDSKGRGAAFVAVIGGILMLGIYLTVFLIGRENIDIAPSL